MAGEWHHTSLEEGADVLTGFPFKSEQYCAEGVRLLRGDNVAQGVLRWDAAKMWPASDTEGLQDYWLREGDVILAMDRPWIEAGLKYASIRRDDLPALLVQRVARIRGKNHLRTDFLRYVIGNTDFTNYILGVQTGTAVPHISASQIRAYRFRCPSVTTQHAIASILGALDDKIELNRQTGETLEAMAQALFKSWFVDFDPVHAKAEGRIPTGMDSNTAALFPGEFEQSDMGPIPKGWSARPLDTVASFQNGLALQKFRPQEGEDRLPVVKIAQLRTGNPDSNEWARSDIDSHYILNDGDIVFSWSGSLTVRVWCGGRAALNQHLFKVTSEKYPRALYLGWLLHHLPDFQRIASAKATTMGHIQRHHLSAASCAVPPKSMIADLCLPLDRMLQRQITLDLETKVLTQVRDTLLPKLLSGALPIRDAEQFLR